MGRPMDPQMIDSCPILDSDDNEERRDGDLNLHPHSHRRYQSLSLTYPHYGNDKNSSLSVKKGKL